MDAQSRLPPDANAILGGLPESEFRPIERHLQPVRLRRGFSLHQGGEAAGLYFPTCGIISVHSADRTGVSPQLVQIGSEGIAGLQTLLGGGPGLLHAVVQSAGQAYRLPAGQAIAAFARGGEFRASAVKYSLGQLVQLAHAAFCNRHHTVEQHVSRWLLSSADRLQTDLIQATHEDIAGILGVRRQGVTEVANKLEQLKLIACDRGRISVLDRLGLERRACDCYRAARREIHLLPSS